MKAVVWICRECKEINTVAPYHDDNGRYGRCTGKDDSWIALHGTRLVTPRKPADSGGGRRRTDAAARRKEKP